MRKLENQCESSLITYLMVKLGTHLDIHVDSAHHQPIRQEVSLRILLSLRHSGCGRNQRRCYSTMICTCTLSRGYRGISFTRHILAYPLRICVRIYPRAVNMENKHSGKYGPLIDMPPRCTTKSTMRWHLFNVCMTVVV